MDIQQAERMRALWKSGYDKFKSFFTVLNEVRQEVGDDALPAWCRNELYIGLSVITDMSKILLKTDQEIVRFELATANKIEKEKRAAEASVAHKAREEEAHKRELEKIERAKELVERRAELAVQETAAKKAKDTESRRQRKKSLQHERGPGADAKRRKRACVQGLAQADPSEFRRRWNDADKLCVKGIKLSADGRAHWIEGSIAKAQILCAARDACGPTQDFGAWIGDNSFEINKNDRAALISLGRLGEPRMREIFNLTDSCSYQVIWQDNKPSFHVVENGEA